MRKTLIFKAILGQYDAFACDKAKSCGRSLNKSGFTQKSIKLIQHLTHSGEEMLSRNISPFWNYPYLPMLPFQYSNPIQVNLFGNAVLSPSPSTPPTPSNATQNNEREEPNNHETREIEEEVNLRETNRLNNLKGKKIFKKDKICPVQGCCKKYSSRIALRAHLRKQHPHWMEETSDYEP